MTEAFMTEAAVSQLYLILWCQHLEPCIPMIVFKFFVISIFYFIIFHLLMKFKNIT